MNNWINFIDKNVNITVAFASATMSGGSIPQFYSGTLKSINDDSILLSDASKIIAKGLKCENISINNVLINKNYIILIEEI